MSYLIWCFLVVANTHIATLKKRIGFKWVVASALGPIATIWFIFFLKPIIPKRESHIYMFYKDTLLKRERGISDWEYQNRVIEELQKELQRESFDSTAFLRLSGYLSACLEAKRSEVGWIAAIASVNVAFIIGVVSPLLSSIIEEPDPWYRSMVGFFLLSLGIVPFIIICYLARKYHPKHANTALISEALNIVLEKKQS
ncbi:hypothetical protein E2R60_05970 [Paenibacillus dendritiformis]|uniref:hypothetical protein n=1 Tax=Paenibacillus dendritiformis TaxID=130049 RepID=UPI00105935CA|nr:hypothetical protein [Paenibacillus dendritiformis]TDL58010.1 hypothetical protein E2R60_05970 [Paenibacillus dendritiformis]